MSTLCSMVNETGNRKRILMMCKFRIRFRLVHCGTITSVTCYGFRLILHAVQKFPTELKLSSADFVLSGKFDQKYKSDFRDVQILLSVSINALWNDYVGNSLRIFTKFCTLLDACCFCEKPELHFRF